MLNNLIDIVVGVINDHILLLYLLVFLASYIEFLFLVGNIFPGTTLLFLTSFIASMSEASIFLMLLLGVIGSILGDISSYWLGRRYGKSLLIKFGIVKEEKEYEIMIKKSKKKWAFMIFFGKLNSFIRSFTGFVGGMRRLSVKEFFVSSVLGDVVWVMVFILLPYLLGSLAKRYLYFVDVGALVLILLIFLVISIADGSFREVIDMFKKVMKK